MSRPLYDLPPEAITAARRFLKTARRAYQHKREPKHPSLREVALHLTRRRFTVQPINPATLARALRRAGVKLEHWRTPKPRKRGRQ